MNVKGAGEALKEYLEMERQQGESNVGASTSAHDQTVLRALKAEATLEVMVRLGIFGHYPLVEQADGTVISKSYPVTVEDVPDLWQIDLDAELTPQDIAYGEELARKYGLV